VTDIEILAEIAFQIAMAEKNRSRAVPADERRFLAEMGMISVNNGMIGGAADAFLTVQPVDAAFSGAKLAVLQYFGDLLDLFLQKPAFQCVDITGSVVVH
jgi:hypothetical protein